MIIRSLQRTLHPAWYQGHGKDAPYFEGWYYKLVDSSERHRLAIIPGIFKGADPETSHAFVQVLDGRSGKATYHTYPTEAFWAAEQGLDVRVGPNRFALDRIELEIDTDEWSLRGALELVDLTRWPSSVVSPGVMGFFAWIPLLQTYHEVVSLDHVIHGTLAFHGETIDFSEGRGYMEKDGDGPSPKPGSGCRPTISVAPGPVSLRPSPPSPCWDSRFGVSSSGCGTVAISIASLRIRGPGWTI